MSLREFESHTHRVDVKFESATLARVKGIWMHYSGVTFEVLGVAESPHANEPDIVLYKGTRSGKLYYRPVEEFLGQEDVDDDLVPRFTYVGK